jgi:hypothetical protein
MRRRLVIFNCKCSLFWRAKALVCQLERFDVDAGIEAAGHFFICCFSGDGDDLGQWRAYADDGRGN